MGNGGGRGRQVNGVMGLRDNRYTRVNGCSVVISEGVIMGERLLGVMVRVCELMGEV